MQVFELGREGGLDFIVMELVEGKPLTELLGGRALAPEKVASIGEQVARALARAHQKQLLHRDIKPGNILVTADGDVKVVDFGLAALFQTNLSGMDTAISTVSRGAALQGDGRIAGTLPYMSPEQVSGEKLDGRSDVFSLGSVLYEMTTGRRPFSGASASELAGEIRRARAAPVKDLRPDVPMDLDRIIGKALAAKPADRYQTMQDLAVDLKRLGRDLESGSAPSYKELQSGQARVPARSRVARWVVVGVAVAALVAAGAWTVVSRRAAAAARAHTILIMPFEVRGQASGDEYLGRAFSEQMAVSLAQSNDLRVLPVASESDLVASGTLDRMRTAHAAGAGMILTGSLTRDANSATADLTLTDVDDNRLMWGTRKSLAIGQKDLSDLATSLVHEVREQLGLRSIKTYDWSVPYGSPEFLASPELAEAMGHTTLERARDLGITSRLIDQFPREPFAFVLRTMALHWNYGSADLASKGRQELESTLDTLRRLDPNSPWDDLFRAALLQSNGQFAEAISRNTNALARDDLAPNQRVWLMAARAESRASLGHMQASIADLQEALRLVPMSWVSLSGYGHTLLMMGRNDEGLKYLERALALYPTRPDRHSDVGAALERMGRMEDAIAPYSAACDLALKKSDCIPFGLALGKQGRFSTALPLLDAACAEDRAHCGVYAIVLHRAGRAPEARAAAEKAATPPEAPSSLYPLARYHALAGDPLKAIQYLKRDMDLGDYDIWIASDPDLNSLHGDPQFEAIVAEIRKRIAS